MNIGDKVKLKTPFQETFPGTYDIIAFAIAQDTYTIDLWGDTIGSDFYIDYLENA